MKRAAKSKYMSENDFKEILKSVDQMKAHMRGEKVPGVKVTRIPKPKKKS